MVSAPGRVGQALQQVASDPALQGPSGPIHKGPAGDFCGLPFPKCSANADSRIKGGYCFCTLQAPRSSEQPEDTQIIWSRAGGFTGMLHVPRFITGSFKPHHLFLEASGEGTWNTTCCICYIRTVHKDTALLLHLN